MNFSRIHHYLYCLSLFASKSPPSISFYNPLIGHGKMYTAPSCFTVGLEGSQVTTEDHYELQLLARHWIVTEKINEVSLFMTQDEIKDGSNPGFAAAKFLCYSKDDPTKKPALIRIYRQIPVLGIEWANPEIRASQAVPLLNHNELKAFKKFRICAYAAVPRLLGYTEQKQGGHTIIPNGASTILVWEKVRRSQGPL